MKPIIANTEFSKKSTETEERADQGRYIYRPREYRESKRSRPSQASLLGIMWNRANTASLIEENIEPTPTPTPELKLPFSHNIGSVRLIIAFRFVSFTHTLPPLFFYLFVLFVDKSRYLFPPRLSSMSTSPQRNVCTTTPPPPVDR